MWTNTLLIHQDIYLINNSSGLLLETLINVFDVIHKNGISETLNPVKNNAVGMMMEFASHPATEKISQCLLDNMPKMGASVALGLLGFIATVIAVDRKTR